MNAISNIEFNTLYIASDDLNHPIITSICNKYLATKKLHGNEIETIQYGSTCKNIILSHGSFSAVIGYLAFFSKIFYPKYDKDKIWYGDMFSIDGWNII